MRASLQYSRRRPTNFEMFTGQCTRTWPPAGFIRNWEAEGFLVEPADVVGFTIFVRLPRPGHYVIRGYRLVWDEDGRLGQFQTDVGWTMKVEVVPRSRASKAYCTGRHEYPGFFRPAGTG